MIGWRPPWQIGALEEFRRPRSHLFVDQLRGKRFDLARLSGAVAAVDDRRLDAFRAAIPVDWNSAKETVDTILKHVAAIRDNLAPALQEIRRVLQ